MQDEILLIQRVFENITLKKQEKRVKKLPAFFKKKVYALIDNIILLKNDCNYSRLIILHGNCLGILGNLYETIKLIDYCLRKNCVPSKIKISFAGGLATQQFLVHIIDTMIYLKNSIPVPRASYDDMRNTYKVIEHFTKHGHCLKQQTEYPTHDVMLYLRHLKKNFGIVYDDVVMQIVRRYPRKLLLEEADK